jgi:hypothetical protein
LPYLEVSLVIPNASFISNVIQNNVFTVNSTVYCRLSGCGNVSATVKYNQSSDNPDDPVSIISGDIPFYIEEAEPSETKYCQDLLGTDEFCSISWVINATGEPGTEWKLGVMFNSSSSQVQSNQTENATVSILPCTEDFNINWYSLNFGYLDPNTGPNDALGNENNEYNITINPGSCKLDLYIKGTNLTSSTSSLEIDVGSVLWNNASNAYASSFNLTEYSQIISSNINSNNVTTWYWINVPPIYAGLYNGLLTITGARNG